MMLNLEPQINAEYERAPAAIGDFCELEGKVYLKTSDVLRAHFQIANHFFLEGEGLGGIGPRDYGLLNSAIHRQAVSFEGTTKWTNLFDIAATLFYGLIKNHAFHDANKRTAFLSVLYQLHENGWCPSVSEKDFEDFTVEVADNQLGKYPRYRGLVGAGEADPEVKFMGLA
ncbi:type II toxin-antitoxin system death-on-curing family toxin [Ferrovibrio sp.]|uniref:type II toxin-antitoxin system death-on-curing family toxin n=1 Tax=Ferrovibrio sp. TaxID=1917215 RepID=UPI0035AFA03A